MQQNDPINLEDDVPQFFHGLELSDDEESSENGDENYQNDLISINSTTKEYEQVFWFDFVNMINVIIRQNRSIKSYLEKE